jgi:hypothetical protein
LLNLQEFSPKINQVKKISTTAESSNRKSKSNKQHDSSPSVPCAECARRQQEHEVSLIEVKEKYNLFELQQSEIEELRKHLAISQLDAAAKGATIEGLIEDLKRKYGEVEKLECELMERRRVEVAFSSGEVEAKERTGRKGEKDEVTVQAIVKSFNQLSQPPLPRSVSSSTAASPSTVSANATPKTRRVASISEDKENTPHKMASQSPLRTPASVKERVMKFNQLEQGIHFYFFFVLVVCSIFSSALFLLLIV